MARYKHYESNQLMMVPVSLEDQLVPGTLEYAIHHVVEERVDLSFFDERYRNDETGRKAIAPKILIKVVLFGYSRGMTSSRSLEKSGSPIKITSARKLYFLANRILFSLDRGPFNG